jgi:hypothetical protein
MKYSKNQLGNILHENLGIHKNNCDTMVDFMIAVQSARTVNLSQMSNYTNCIIVLGAVVFLLIYY